MSSTAPVTPLAFKLAKILGEVGKVPKSGHNSFHNYDYVTENDLVYAVRDKLADAGIFVFTSVESQAVQIIKDEDKTTALTTVVTKHTFVDGWSGEQFSVLSQGQGADVGDKGGYKAITGAMNYFLYKCFMIPTGDDPEADERTDQRAASAGQQRREPARQDPPPREEPPPQQEQHRPAAAAGGSPNRFRDGAWKEVAIHFGKNYKGVALGSMSKSALSGWLKWEPKPFNGKIDPADALLRLALDAAAEEVSPS